MSSHADATPLKSGDLVQLDFELWAEGGAKTELIGTTREEVARKAEAHVHEGQHFGAQPHLVGGDFFPAGIEAVLEGAKVGEELTKEFAPADAFGERDPKLIELFSMHEISRLPEMRREDAELDIGTVLTIKGRRGRVVSLTAARVRVDFNPAFAGRKVRGVFKVEKRIEEPVDQVRALLELQYGHGSDFGLEVHGHAITIQVPDRTKFDINWMAVKPRLIDRLRTQLKPTSIKIVEEYVTPVAEKETKKAKPGADAPKEKAVATTVTPPDAPATTHPTPATPSE